MDTDMSPLPQSTQLPYAPVGWHRFAWWMLASFCGLGLGLFATVAIVILGSQYFNIGLFLLAILVGGAVLGALQLSFLNVRRAIVSSHQWLMVSIIGCSLAVGVTVATAGIAPHIPFLSSTAITTLAICLVGPVNGLILGTSQWVVLRRTSKQAALWIVTNVASSSIIWIILLLLAGLALSGPGD